MNWKKNYFSYAVWLIYTLISGFGVLTLAGNLQLPIWQTAGISTVAVVLAGPLVLLLHKFALKSPLKNRPIMVVAVEIAVVILIAVAGICYRTLKFPEAVDESFYFQLASLEAGRKIPQIAHGAVFFYLQILREVFFFFGNQLTVAIWFQILVQSAAFLVLYFAVRQMTGRLPALIMLGLCEFSGYMTESSLRLSPDCLYLLFWAVSMIWIASIRGEKTDPIEYIPVGIFTALMGYTDVMGFLLFFVAIAMIFRAKEEKQEQGSGRNAVLVCLGSTVISFFLFLFLDSCLSKKGFINVLKAWAKQYYPEKLHIPGTLGTGVSGYGDLYVLFALLLLGIFSFWWDKKKDYVKGWILFGLILILGECFGIFTGEVPAATYLYLMFSIIAGIGVRECFRRVYVGMENAGVEEEIQKAVPEMMEELAGAGHDSSQEKQELTRTMEDAPEAKRNKDSNQKEDAQRIQQISDEDVVAGTIQESCDDGTTAYAESSGILEGREMPEAQEVSDVREEPEVQEVSEGDQETYGKKQAEKPEQTDIGEELQENIKQGNKESENTEKRSERIEPGEFSANTDSASSAPEDEKASVEEEKTSAIHFIENPLPLPKKHVRRVADFAIGASANDDYDYIVSDDDDFDID